MDQLKKLLASLTNRQKIAIVLIVLATGAGLTWFTNQQRENDFRPLFTSLAPEDAAAMVQKVKEKGVAYRISENGTTILVPSAKLAELRLEMAGIGLPKTGRIGFEIFDKTNFAITDFTEHVNYRRAIEGELERSVMSLHDVEQARVHVTFPKDSVFLESREPAKASVLVRLRQGGQLSGQNVSAITHLVASAVEGLNPDQVSVLDMQGNLLNRPRRIGDDAPPSIMSVEFQSHLEKELTAKINSTLEPLLGANKFRSGVSVDCDVTNGEQSDETFDPSKSVMATSQKTEETPGTVTVAAGVPGTAANLPNPPPKPSTTTRGQSRREEKITYQSSRVVRHIKLAEGIVKRISTSVLVDQDVKWEGQGAKARLVLVPPSPEKLKTIHDVVATLVGFTAARGDQLIVETLPFESTLNSEPPLPAAPEGNPSHDRAGWLNDKQVRTGIAFAVVVVVLGVVLFVMLRNRRRALKLVAAENDMSALQAGLNSRSLLDASHARPALGHGYEPLPALSPTRSETLLVQLQSSAKTDADLWAGILRGWLSQESPK